MRLPVVADEPAELAAQLVGLAAVVWLALVRNGSLGAESPPSEPIASWSSAPGTSQTLCESKP